LANTEENIKELYGNETKNKAVYRVVAAAVVIVVVVVVIIVAVAVVVLV
jgi:hypothetical protein